MDNTIKTDMLNKTETIKTDMFIDDHLQTANEIENEEENTEETEDRKIKKNKLKELLKKDKLELEKYKNESKYGKIKRIKTDNTFFVCLECNIIISSPYNSVAPIDRHLKTSNHLKKLSVPDKQTMIKSYFAPPLEKNKSNSLKKEIGISYAELVCNEFVPFSLINKPAFQKFCKILIDTGSVYGAVNIRDVLADESTIRQNYLSDLFNKVVSDCRKKAASIKRVNVCADVWTDTMNNKYYLGITASYFNEKLVTITPGIILLEGKKDYISILSNTYTLLENIFDKNVTYSFVTDKGANLIKAYKDHINIRCINHGINNAVQELIDDSNFEEISSENQNLPKKYFHRKKFMMKKMKIKTIILMMKKLLKIILSTIF